MKPFTLLSFFLLLVAAAFSAEASVFILLLAFFLGGVGFFFVFNTFTLSGDFDGFVRERAKPFFTGHPFFSAACLLALGVLSFFALSSFYDLHFETQTASVTDSPGASQPERALGLAQLDGMRDLLGLG